jgi:hydrogenase 3 maturation protease
MLEELRRRTSGKRLVIVGVGNPLRGDDGIGPALVERLSGKTRAILVDGGEVPENYLDLVEQARPDVVLIIDAVDLRAAPGDVALIEMGQLAGAAFTTHNATLAVFAKALQAATGADVFVLAIQPSTTSVGAPMSAPLAAILPSLDRMLSAVSR